MRNHWRWDRYPNRWFGRDWWRHHYHPLPAWHYWHNFGHYNWAYWWTAPTWAGLGGWFTWGAPATPVYYDYGQGGNVYYQNNAVYVNGQEVASAPEFAASAAELATVPPPENPAEAEQAEWMPLGTFAISSNEKESEPARVIQLAVNKEGIVSGTLYNTQTDKAMTVQGRVDQETQRVALRFGESENIVAETGLYNLTQDEAPLLVHFGTDKVETYLLVRLQAPPEQEAQAATALE